MNKIEITAALLTLASSGHEDKDEVWRTYEGFLKRVTEQHNKDVNTQYEDVLKIFFGKD